MAQRNLYPPRIDRTYQDAALCTSPLRVYFALSEYLDFSLVNPKLVQVTCQAMGANKDSLKYENGIVIKDLFIDNNRTTEDKYYVELTPADLRPYKQDDIQKALAKGETYSEKFEIATPDAVTKYAIVTMDKQENKTVKWEDGTDVDEPLNSKLLAVPLEKLRTQFNANYDYKIQLRFTGLGAEEFKNNFTPAERTAWFNNNTEHFSEWSKITIGLFINNPELTINDKHPQETLDNKDYLKLNVKLNNLEKTDYLTSYRVILYRRDKYRTEIEYDSQVAPCKNYEKELYIEIPRILTDSKYGLNFTYTLENGYTCDNYFGLQSKDTETSPITTTIVPNDINGQVRLDIYSKNPEVELNKNIRILRSDSETDFKHWENVATIEMNGGYAIYWIDSSCESDVWYKYAVQLDTLDNEYNTHIVQNPVRLEMDDTYLINNYSQLKIKYNPKISSFKYVVKENITETLGTKYAFVQRNGAVKYRSFPISGTIARSMDDNEVFRADHPLFKKSITQAFNNDFNDRNGILLENDMQAERRFREEVEELLYSPDACLFKSPSEGNIIVKLTDVSLTPIESLGRRLYSFSANCTEIDEVTVENLDKYKIQKNKLDLLYDWVIVVDSMDELPIIPVEDDAEVSINENGGYIIDVNSIPENQLLFSREYIKDNSFNYGVNLNYKKRGNHLVLTEIVEHDTPNSSVMAYTGTYNLN